MESYRAHQKKRPDGVHGDFLFGMFSGQMSSLMTAIRVRMSSLVTLITLQSVASSRGPS